MINKKQWSAGVAAAVLSMSLSADDASQWLVTPTVGYQWIDNARGVDDATVKGIGLEYQYNNNLATEIKYLTTDPDVLSGAGDVDYDQYIIEGLYYFDGYQQARPYILAGIGHGKFDFDRIGPRSDQEETQLHLGAGLRQWVNDRLSVRADFRIINSIDETDVDRMLSVGISYAFGKRSSGPQPVAAAPAPQAVAAAAPPPRPVDSDRDGVMDDVDQCPNTVAGARVDAQGCALKLTTTETISMNVQFDNNSSVVKSEFLPEIEKVAVFMKEYPTVNGDIEGHTDSTGTEEYNQFMSQRRADAVRQVLVERFWYCARSAESDWLR